MKIAVISIGQTIDPCIITGTNHSEYLLIIDPATMHYEAMQNPIFALKGPTWGKLLARPLLHKKEDTISTKSCGMEAPKVFEEMGDIGIQIFAGVAGLVRKAVERLN